MSARADADQSTDAEAQAAISDAAERRGNIRTVRRVAPYLWPADAPWVRKRVVVSLAALVLAKLIAVATPFFYKAAVDVLGGDAEGSGWMLAIGAVGLTVAYGMARLMNSGFQQLRDALFARVGQRALRRIALETSGTFTASRCAFTSAARRAGCRASSSAG